MKSFIFVCKFVKDRAPNMSKSIRKSAVDAALCFKLQKDVDMVLWYKMKDFGIA